MSDDNQQSSFDFLKDLSFAPGWAKNPPQEQTLSQFSGSDDAHEERGMHRDREGGKRGSFRREDRGPRRDGPRGERMERGDRGERNSFRRDDRGPRREDRGPRREESSRPMPPREERPERKEGDRNAARPAGNRGGERPQQRGGERPFRGHREPRVDLSTLPVEVRFLPDQKEMGVVIRKVQAGHRAYPVRELARLFLEHPSACMVRLEVKAAFPDLFLHQCDKCGFVSTDPEALRAHMLEKHFDEEFESSTVEGEAPTGAFSCVAKCGISGRLIGPPNHHSFAQRLRDVMHEVAPGMSEETYRHRLEMVHDEEAIQQWKDEAKVRTVYRRKKVEEPAAEAAKPAPEAAPVEASPVEVEAPEAPVEKEPEEEPMLDRAMAEAVFEHDIVPKCTTNRKRVSCTFDQAQVIRDPQIAPVVREIWRQEQRSAGSLFIALRGAFRAKKFQLFRANDDRGMEFVIPKTPVALDTTHAVPELVQVMDYVRDHRGCTRADLFAALGIPTEGKRTEEQDKIYQQFAWIVESAHLIEYHNGVLALPDAHPYFRPLPRPRPAAAEEAVAAPVAAEEEAASPVAAEEAPAEEAPAAEAVAAEDSATEEAPAVEPIAEEAPAAQEEAPAPVVEDTVADEAPAAETQD